MKEYGYVGKTERVENPEAELVKRIKAFRNQKEICPMEDAQKQDGTAVHDDGEKEPIHLIPPEAMMALATVYKFGARKYSDPRNWERGMDWSRVYNSAMRHLLKFWQGEDNDPESGLPHTWHALWNVTALVWYRAHHADLDDRPAKKAADSKKPGWSILI